MSTFAKVPAQFRLPEIEERILQLWESLDAFHESNRRRQAAGGREFVFYDGPPFATGTPHYGHLLAGTIKDIVPRYWSMRGCHVDRRFGWDCHGLPIENLAQKALKLNGAPEIRAHGVDRFNEQCRSMVQTYVAEWRKTVTRMGRWVDFDRDYKTMDRDFMESVWWVFKHLWDKGRVYKAHRIMPYSPKLTTPLSNFEAGNNYQDVQDPAVTVRFRVNTKFNKPGPFSPSVLPENVDDSRLYVLAWTTTPWTLPGNLALAVGPKIVYCWVHDLKSNDVYLIAKERISTYYKKTEDYTVLREVMGSSLGGLGYEPLFPYAPRPSPFSSGPGVLTADFVTTGEGTGIVHIAPAFGEDDYKLCQAHRIPLFDYLDEECKLTGEVAKAFGSIFCKDADKAIIKHLKDEGKLVHQSTIVHSYPFCERTGAPLIYRAMDAWFVRVSDLRPRMVEVNAQIRWVPESIGANRFGNFISDGPDWNISRNRFWGSCLPVWVNVADPADTICVGSVAELERLSGKPVTDLHKHFIDPIEIHRDGKTYRRTPEVLDCWFESGAMPYAQGHYPFANKAAFEAAFPAQFIAEGLDQTRGWFYSLLVLSVALFDKPAFNNVVVNGMILAEDGAKMSKSKQNYPDPGKVLASHGADALRAYLIDSPVVRAEPLRFSEKGLSEIVRTVVLPTWNALAFFTTYASVDNWDPRTATARSVAQRHVLDRWILSVMQSLIRDVNREMEAYRLYTVVPRLVAFIDDLTNWYIRVNRRRFWKNDDAQDQQDAYATLYAVLTTFPKVLAPFMPFITEEIHQRLVVAVDAQAAKSVHWCDFPQADATLIDADLEARIADVRLVVGLGRKLREEHKLKIRQPLAKLTVISHDPRCAALADDPLLLNELNLKQVGYSSSPQGFCTTAIKPNLKTLGRRLGAKLKDIQGALATMDWTFTQIETVLGGGTVTICGEALGKDDLLISMLPEAGKVVASSGAVTVALDTALTPELVGEGHARELVSVLQQARKDAGLEVSDRIRVQWSCADAVVAAAISRHADYIAGEVLATAFTQGGGSQDADINGCTLRFAIAKA